MINDFRGTSSLQTRGIAVPDQQAPTVHSEASIYQFTTGQPTKGTSVFSRPAQ